MNRRKRKGFIASGVLLLSFVLWTFLIQTVDVQPVGVNGTSVGFAAVNTWFHRLTGVHMGIYTITDWLGLVPIAVCIGFGMLGLMQWIRRKSITKVDRDILLLGGYYILVILGYLIFEMIPINYRPILIEGGHGGLLSLLYHPAGAQRDAHAAVPDKPAGKEPNDPAYHSGVCHPVFRVHGDRQTGGRGALAHGYRWFCAAERRAVLSV